MKDKGGATYGLTYATQPALFSDQFDITGNQDFKTAVPENILTATAFQKINGLLKSSTSIDLHSMVKNSELTWRAPEGNWKIVVVYKNEVKTPFDPMNFNSGSGVSFGITLLPLSSKKEKVTISHLKSIIYLSIWDHEPTRSDSITTM